MRSQEIEKLDNISCPIFPSITILLSRADSREFSLENSREFLGKIEDRRFSRIFQNSREFSRIFYSTVEPNFGKNSEKFKIFGIFHFLRLSDLMNSKLHRSVQNERIL